MKNIKLALTSLLAAGTIASGQLSTLQFDGTYNADLSALAASVLDGSFDPTTAPGWMSGGSVVPIPSFAPGEQWDIIFVGEYASWENDLNLAVNLESDGALGASSSVMNIFDDVDMTGMDTGAFRRLTVDASTAGTFDFILNSSEANAGGANGGNWRMFAPAYNDPASNFDYGYMGMDSTYGLFAFEDWNQNNPGSQGGPSMGAPDFDRNDFVFGLRYVGMVSQAVPEPSTYGMIGAAALLGLVIVRRLKRSKN